MNKSQSTAFAQSSRGYDQQILHLSTIKKTLVTEHEPRLKQLEEELAARNIDTADRA